MSKSNALKREALDRPENGGLFFPLSEPDGRVWKKQRSEPMTVPANVYWAVFSFASFSFVETLRRF